jgi:hypothetical protein
LGLFFKKPAKRGMWFGELFGKKFAKRGRWLGKSSQKEEGGWEKVRKKRKVVGKKFAKREM